MTDEIEEIENLKKFESLIGQIEKDAKSKDVKEEDANKEIEKWAKSIKGRKVTYIHSAKKAASKQSLQEPYLDKGLGGQTPCEYFVVKIFLGVLSK